MRQITLYCLLLLCYKVYSQKNINTYKYVIVPDKYNFQKSKNQYQINDLVAFLLKKRSFLVIREKDDFPKDLKKDRCLALTVDVTEKSGFFTTKVTVRFVDCFNKVVLSTQGESREKNYKKAYQQAVRNAFETIPTQNLFPPKKINTVKKTIHPKNKSLVKQLQSNISPLSKKESLLGNYLFSEWGKCSIIKKGNSFSLITGDENFEVALIYKTSKPNVFIIKWKTDKTPFLLEKLANGNIAVDSKTTTAIIKKI